MDFDIPEELRQLVSSVRRFRERELMPLEHHFLTQGRFTVAERNALDDKAKQAGLWALEPPEELGGQGLGQLGMCLVLEELFKHPAMYVAGGNPEPVLYHCRGEQRDRYLLPVIRGERMSCYAFTEPDAGSDVGGMRLTARRDGDHWVLNGTKTFISKVDFADFVIVFAVTSGARRMSVFLVDMDTPRFSISREIKTMGDDWDPCEISFVDCVVPDANRIGEVGEGWRLAAEQLNHGRLKIAAYQLGIAERCIEIALEWAKHRVTWGKPIATRQGIQWMLADSRVELEAARMLVYRAAWKADRGQEHAQDDFIAKLYATEMAQRVCDRCLQILGGIGYTTESPVQSFYRQVRLWRIGHGTSEIHRWMIARTMLGDAARDNGTVPAGDWIEPAAMDVAPL
jgi:acyl-CoA dehydrogenase